MSGVYGLVIFVSAYLLFQVQPLTSKSILPWFGGTPSVWTTCMLFFQILLFAGYAYAHLLSSKLSPKAQLVTHTILMGIALTASVLPAETWKPTGAENPIVRIVSMLAVSIGVPFFVLSSTGPLVQNWFSRAQAGRSPYHLYSLSNLGSMLGLLLYPFYVEIAFNLPEQGQMWWWGFVIFVVGCVVCGLNFASQTETAGKSDQPVSEDLPAPTWRKKILWFLLAAMPSVMLLATTNQLCLDVASIPFLWVLPLTLYLLTFILAFAGDRWYFRNTCAVMLPISLGLMINAMLMDADASLEIQIVSYLAGLFFTAMCCHGELVRIRPAPQHLTGFYLWMSAGGAAGGLFVGLVAPFVFDLYLELHVAIFLTLVLIGVVRVELVEGERWWHFYRTPGVIFLSLAISATLFLWKDIENDRDASALITRNFYGVLRIRQKDDYVISDWTKPIEGTVEVSGTEYPCVTFLVPEKAQFTGAGDENADPVVPSGCFKSGVYEAYPIGNVKKEELFPLVQAENPTDLPPAPDGQKYVTCRTKEPTPCNFEVRVFTSYRSLLNGRILHGNQYLDDVHRVQPTTYYSRKSAIGLALQNHNTGKPRHLAVVGLGTGTVAAYGQTGDRLTYYEINDDVLEIAAVGTDISSANGDAMPAAESDKVWFSYLNEFKGEKPRVILGDARLAMERAESEQFDILVLDAFSSDAIPAHLLTEEAFEVYMRHMKDDGIIVVHISNRHFELDPVVAGLAEKFNLADRYLFDDPEDYEEDDPDGFDVTSSEWVLLARSDSTVYDPDFAVELLESSVFDNPAYSSLGRMTYDRKVYWTDAESSLWKVLRENSPDQIKRDLNLWLKSLGIGFRFDLDGG